MKIKKTSQKKIKHSIGTSKTVKKTINNQEIDTLETNFLDMLKSADVSDVEGPQIENISQLVSKIDKQGEKFSEHPIMEELVKYKSLIHQLLKITVGEAYTLKVINGIKRGGLNKKQYITIKNINNKLTSLTSYVLNKEKKPLNLMQQLDDIRGLLIDLYK